jgi:transketolase C-terminal domain/subunit
MNFFDTACVSSTFEFGSEPDSDQIANGSVADQIAWQTKNINVIVPATHFGHYLICTRCCSHTAKFVRNNSHTETVPADQYSAFGTAIGNFLRDGNGIVWVIDGLVVVRAKVFYFVTIGRQQCD